MDFAGAQAKLEAGGAYVLTTEHACHDCGCIVPVFAVLAVGPFRGEGDVDAPEDSDGASLSQSSGLPYTIASYLTKASNGNFRSDVSRTANARYWMNHCQECGAKIGDWYLHSEPGEGFFFNGVDEAVNKLEAQYFEGPFTFVDPSFGMSSVLDDWLALQPVKSRSAKSSG